MASKVTVALVDDLDSATPADETVRFQLDGVSYEIDLSAQNASRLRGDFQAWVNASRRTGDRCRKSAMVASSLMTRDNPAIRAWAHRNGIEIAARGRIPANVHEAYLASRV